MGDERKYFFGYAKNISRAGIFIQTITPKAVGDEFMIDFTIPKTDINVRCRCRVVWSRTFSQSSTWQEPGMGLAFLDLDPDTSEKVNQWVLKRLEDEENEAR
jgi:uncharacterized protein (TIGR02266 family)